MIEIKPELPYLIRIIKERQYNPAYGDARVCKCGHPYYRHFDSYEDNDPCGCKYCGCDTFEEAPKETYANFEEFWEAIKPAYNDVLSVAKSAAQLAWNAAKETDI